MAWIAVKSSLPSDDISVVSKKKWRYWTSLDGYYSRKE